MKNISSMDSWPSSLDTGIPLAQELNCSPGEGTFSAQAESGGLSPAYHTRETSLKPEEALALAIVQQAVEDWRRAVNTLRLQPDHPAATSLKKETERFFRSRWFHTLMDLDGTAFLRRLQREARVSEPEAGSDPRRRVDALRRNALRRVQKMRIAGNF